MARKKKLEVEKEEIVQEVVALEEKKESTLSIQDLQKAADSAKDEITMNYIKLASDVNEELNSLTSSSLKRIIRRLMMYPLDVDPDKSPLLPTAQKVLDAACRQKDLYVELGMIAHKSQMIESMAADINKTETAKDKKEN